MSLSSQFFSLSVIIIVLLLLQKKLKNDCAVDGVMIYRGTRFGQLFSN